MLPEPEMLAGGLEDRRVELPDGAIFRNATVIRCDIGGQRIPIFQVEATTFDSCDFSRVRVDAGTLGVLPFATYRDCRFVKSDLSRVLPGVARFERCLFEKARIDKWFAFQAEFVECTFVGPIKSVRFYGTVGPPELIQRIGRTTNEFRDNDFSQADLVDVEFVGGIDLDAQRWPDSPPYQRIDLLADRLRAGRAVVEGWPPSPDREAALAELTTLSEVYRGQDSVNRWARSSSDLFERIWAIIAEAKPLS
jgi:hypothetical protein